MLLPNLMAALASLQGEAAPGPHFPFEPTRIIATADVVDGSLNCRMTFQGRDISGAEGNRCSFVTDTGLQASLRALGHGATWSMVIGLGPQGTPHPEDAIDRGELIAESSASYDVRPDGNIANCRQTANRVIRRMQGMHDPRDMCTFPLLRVDAFERAPNTAARRGEASLRVYLRAAGQEARPSP